MSTLKDAKPGDVIVAVGVVVSGSGGQVLVEWGPDSIKWSMANSVDCQIVRPGIEVIS